MMPVRMLVVVIPVIAIALAAPLASAQIQQSLSQPIKSEWPQNWFYPNIPEKLSSLTGRTAPALQVKEWYDDVQVRPEDLRGKVVVIDFWGTWCGPCMAAIPKNAAMVSKYQSQGLAFIGVHDASRGWNRVPQVMSQGTINYPVALDADGGVSTRAFGVPFWPTYIIIDRAGIVRAAGVAPNHVEDIVKVLIAEPAPAGMAPAAEPLDDRFLVSRSRRPALLRELAGKPLPQLAGRNWWEAADDGEPLPAGEELAGRVIAVHFMSARDQRAMHQASMLVELEKKHSAAEFVALGVAPAEEDWERLTELGAEGKAPSRLMLDVPLEENRRAMGAFAEACGVRYVPVTLLVDRRGVVRGAGVRPDKLEEAVELLLAEPKPEVEEDGEDGGG